MEISERVRWIQMRNEQFHDSMIWPCTKKLAKNDLKFSRELQGLMKAILGKWYTRCWYEIFAPRIKLFLWIWYSWYKFWKFVHLISTIKTMKFLRGNATSYPFESSPTGIQIGAMRHLLPVNFRCIAHPCAWNILQTQT